MSDPLECVNYHVLDSHGKLLRYGFCPREAVALQARMREESAIEGPAPAGIEYAVETPVPIAGE